MRHYPPTPCLRGNDNILTLVNGLPCLVGNYGDLDNLLSVERATIQNQLIVETTDPHLSVVDIVVDRIGEHPLGNAEQYQRILEAIAAKSGRLNGTLDTIKPGIEVTLEYELTREKDGTLIRRTSATMFITNRSQYLEHTQPDPVNGPILTNFIDSTVKTITDRAYGADRLVCTLLNLTVAYKALRHVAPPVPNCHCGSELGPDLNLGQLYDGVYDSDRYAGNAKYIMPRPPVPSYNAYGHEYYHFEDAGRKICLHRNEIDSPTAPVDRTVISSTKINKSFIVEGGHRLEIKFSVWIADESTVRDTSKIYRLLDNHCPHPDPYYPGGCHPHHPGECRPAREECHDDRRLYAMIAHEGRRNDYQECDIRQLNSQGERIETLIVAMTEKLDIELTQIKRDIEELKHPVPVPPEPPVPEPEQPEPEPEQPDPDVTETP